MDTHGTPDGGREAASTNPQLQKPTPTVRTASWASDQIPYSDDPYLARLRANVAALGEVTSKLRESASLDQCFETHSRSIIFRKLKQGNEPRANVPLLRAPWHFCFPSFDVSSRQICLGGSRVVLPSAGDVSGIWMYVRVHDNAAPACAHTHAAGWAKTLMAAPRSTPTRSCAA